LRGLDERLRQETNLPVNVIDDPLTCVARGALKIIENLEMYKPCCSIPVADGKAQQQCSG